MVLALEAALGYSGLVVGREGSVLRSRCVGRSSQIGWVPQETNSPGFASLGGVAPLKDPAIPSLGNPRLQSGCRSTTFRLEDGKPSEVIVRRLWPECFCRASRAAATTPGMGHAIPARAYQHAFAGRLFAATGRRISLFARRRVPRRG